MATQAKLQSSALILVVLLLGALAAGNYFVVTQAPFGSCTLGLAAMGGSEAQSPCPPNYLYYFIGAPLVVGLLLLLILPNLVTGGEVLQEAKPAAAPVEPK